MSINFTLIVQFIVFVVLVFMTMRFGWPRLVKAMEERQKKIADGLEAAERGKKNLALAQQKVVKQLREAKSQAGEIIDGARRKKTEIIEGARIQADKESRKMLILAQSDIAYEKEVAREQLREEVVILAIDLVEKILHEHVDEKANKKLIDKFIAEIWDGTASSR